MLFDWYTRMNQAYSELVTVHLLKLAQINSANEDFAR